MSIKEERSKDVDNSSVIVVTIGIHFSSLKHMQTVDELMSISKGNFLLQRTT